VIRKGLFAVVCTLAIGLAWSSPALAENTTPNSTSTAQEMSTKRLSGKTSKPLGQLRYHRRQNAGTMGLLDVPPGGGCQASMAWDSVANYLNHSLSNLTVAYNTQVVCTTTGPSQSMGALVTTAQLWKATTQVAEATPESCTNCLATPVSGSVYVCNGPGCAGPYWVANLFVLGAPDGWDWPSAPSSCVGLGTAPFTLIQCAAVSDIFTISPTF
jgi:hypothetical protein